MVKYFGSLDRPDPRLDRVVKASSGIKDELEDLLQLISQRIGRCLERQGSDKFPLTLLVDFGIISFLRVELGAKTPRYRTRL